MACRHVVDEPCRRVQTWADDCDHVWSEHAEEREALLDEFARTGPTDFLAVALAAWPILAAIAALYILAGLLERNDHGNSR